MTIDPQLLRAEQFTEIGRLIQRDAGLLIQRWSRRAAQEQPDAGRTHHNALLDHLPAFLDALGQTLAEPVGADSGPHLGTAKRHGEQRWENGWSLTEVVRDYQILRLVVLEYLEEMLERALLCREGQAVGLALDEAVTASVESYVRHRDAHHRRAEQERLEAARAQAAALRESDRRKNEFLAVLAHELRNPLAPILNSVEVLRLLGPADPHVIRARDIVERQVKQMVRLVDDLLDVTRIAQGKVELRRTAFDLAGAVAEAIQTTSPLFEAQGHRLEVHLPDEPLRLEADQARVVQVLVNLLNNAAKYTDRGGRVSLTGRREGDEVVVRVRDNGVGIEPDMLARVFDLFTQVGQSVHRAQGGLGIGLTLVRQLVEMHAGRVTAHSEGAGKGSEFAVYLPALGLPAVEAGPGPSARKAAGPSRHVLIIEDNADARGTLQTLLGLLGHRVETAGTGPEGVERATAARPEVVLIDLGLPLLDGYEVARRLRAELGAGVLLVALTGHALDEDRQRTRAAGFNAHLAKPVEVEELNLLLTQSRPPNGNGDQAAKP
ncbi:MAG TPA: hybrid sensor histidine kinase/response regulator [Gemmataceae bacterium]|nr:hybrid sensor histidine kinase/response regulator [Gemmataceae bacterium]